MNTYAIWNVTDVLTVPENPEDAAQVEADDMVAAAEDAAWDYHRDIHDAGDTGDFVYRIAVAQLDPYAESNTEWGPWHVVTVTITVAIQTSVIVGPPEDLPAVDLD